MSAIKKKPHERSFTLVETVIALSLMTFLIIEMTGVQGNAIVFNDFSRRISQASWLGRRVMSQVEYHWATRSFKDLKEDIKDQKFEDPGLTDYSFDLEIKDWKFPFTQLLLGGGDGEKEDEEGGKGGMGGMIKNVVESVFGDEIFKIAHVTVYWPEGAARGSVSLTMLLTNQSKIDDLLTTMKPVWDELVRKERAAINPSPSPSPSASGSPSRTGGGSSGSGGSP